MKRLFLILVLVTLPLSAELAPQHLARLTEAFRIAGTIGPRVWPGFNVGDAPVILIDGANEYLLNTDRAPGGFSKTAQTFRDRPVFARPRTFEPDLEASFPAIGRETVVIGTPEATKRAPANWTLIVLHELFHVYESMQGQDEKTAALQIGPREDASWQLTYPFPYDDVRVRRALHVTGLDLYRCIESPAEIGYESAVAGEALQLLNDLLEASFPGRKDYAYAKLIATKEGLARYFEYRVAELTATDYTPSAQYAQLDGANAFAAVWNARYKAMPFQIKHLGNVSKSRSEFYNLGMGLALVLDRVSPNWRKTFFANGVWLDEAFHRAIEGQR